MKNMLNIAGAFYKKQLKHSTFFVWRGFFKSKLKCRELALKSKELDNANKIIFNFNDADRTDSAFVMYNDRMIIKAKRPMPRRSIKPVDNVVITAGENENDIHSSINQWKNSSFDFFLTRPKMFSLSDSHFGKNGGHMDNQTTCVSQREHILNRKKKEPKGNTTSNIVEQLYYKTGMSMESSCPNTIIELQRRKATAKAPLSSSTSFNTTKPNAACTVRTDKDKCLKEDKLSMLLKKYVKTLNKLNMEMLHKNLPDLKVMIEHERMKLKVEKYSSKDYIYV